jgi:predicted nucleic acid-binding protein
MGKISPGRALSAVALNYKVVTNNTKHYEKIPGLKVVNWA